MFLLSFLYYYFLLLIINHNHNIHFINSVCFIEHNNYFTNFIRNNNNNNDYINNIINNNHKNNRKQLRALSWKSKGIKSLLFSSNSNIITQTTSTITKVRETTATTPTTTKNIRQYDDTFLPTIQVDYNNDNHYYHRRHINTSYYNMDGRYESKPIQPQQQELTHANHVEVQERQLHIVEARENDNKLIFHYDSINNQNKYQILNNSTQLKEQEQQQREHKERREYNKLMIENNVQNQLLNVNEHLHIIYVDDHICVVNKPSGILSVPGIRRNPSLAQLVYDTIIRPKQNNDDINDINYHNERIDRMIVHRLDMDTSGLMIFALNDDALKQLHDDFRTSTSTNTSNDSTNNNNSFHNRRIYKSYQALLVGHYNNKQQQVPSIIEIDIPIERDPIQIPFMRIAQQKQKHHPNNNFDSTHPNNLNNGLDTNNKFVQKYLINQNPKPSYTEMEIIGMEYMNNNSNKIPVTRVNLIPHTGRTHQLRVHTSALGYPIIGDNIYGYNGDGNSGGIQQKRVIPISSSSTNTNIPLCLHAQTLSFYHPYTNIPMIFHSSPPF